VLGPGRVDRVELSADVDAVTRALEAEDARRLAVARRQLRALLERVEDTVGLGSDLGDDQRVGRADDGAIMR
jgi:hypothetical protein